MSRTRSSALLALTLALIAAGLLVLNIAGYLGPVEGLALRPVGAVQGWLAARVAALRTLLTAPADVLAVRQENERLQAQLSRLEQGAIALREQAAEAEIPSALLGYA